MHSKGQRHKKTLNSFLHTCIQHTYTRTRACTHTEKDRKTERGRGRERKGDKEGGRKEGKVRWEVTDREVRQIQHKTEIRDSMLMSRVSFKIIPQPKVI